MNNLLKTDLNYNVKPIFLPLKIFKKIMRKKGYSKNQIKTAIEFMKK